MAISATFNMEVSPYVKDCFDDPSDLRLNPLEEEAVDTKQGIQESFLNPNQVYTTDQAKEDRGKQAMIQ